MITRSAMASEVAVSTMPYLYSLFPRENKHYNFLLLFILFDAHPIGQYKRVCDYAAEAIRFKLCSVKPRQANEILLAYLTIKPLVNNATEWKKTAYEANDEVAGAEKVLGIQSKSKTV